MNTGEGGCFPLHYDGPGGVKDSRRVTALLYMNNDWKPVDGGCLRILPWMQVYNMYPH
jgi:Rps23 Pro-64 3,4-dihydroxylase Tpa1-like proline 4-hydroxylase